MLFPDYKLIARGVFPRADGSESRRWVESAAGKHRAGAGPVRGGFRAGTAAHGWRPARGLHAARSANEFYENPTGQNIAGL